VGLVVTDILIQVSGVREKMRMRTSPVYKNCAHVLDAAVERESMMRKGGIYLVYNRI